MGGRGRMHMRGRRFAASGGLPVRRDDAFALIRCRGGQVGVFGRRWRQWLTNVLYGRCLFSRRLCAIHLRLLHGLLERSRLLERVGIASGTNRECWCAQFSGYPRDRRW